MYVPKSSRRLFTELSTLALPALTVTLGLQLLRVLIPGLSWYMRDTLGVSPAMLGACALGTFLLGFIAAPLRRALGSALSLTITAGGLALVRLGEQIVHQPAADLSLSALGTALFLSAIPIFAAHARSSDPQMAATRLAGGLATGLALDTAIKGFAGTLDLSWWRGIPAVLAVVAEAGLVIVLLRRERAVGHGTNSDAEWRAALPLMGIGPLLFLQAMVYQNQGWIAQVSGLTAEAAFVLSMMGNLVLAAGVWIGLARPYALRPFAACIGATCLALSAGVAAQIAPTFAFTLLIAQFVFGWCLAAIALAAAPPTTRGVTRTSIALNLGMLLLLSFCLAYYVSLERPLPISRDSLLLVAAIAFGLMAVAATTRLSLHCLSSPSSSVVFVAVAGLFLSVMGFSLLQPTPPSPESPAGTSLRVLTFNIHSAYNSQGAQDPEAIARVIESTQPDIVALQEVSRGWLLNGSTDLAAWLADRLEMQVLFQGTADPIWGNALLTRLPILESGSAPLPLAGTRLPRGYLWATIDAGLPEPLMVIVTHLHHVESEHDPRLAQVPVLLNFWSRRPYSILLGDLNSEPGYEEMRMIASAGWVDSWAEAGEGPGLTWPAVDPFERIDWIWHTPDLHAVEAVTEDTTASDHLPLGVRLEVAQ
jgi:endonuclease/exonuclease/phosphatase family metal-dependent hydrolase